MVGGVVSMVAEAAAEGCSLVRRFLARRRAKLGLDSCSRTRGSCWSGRIGRRRGGSTGSTATGAYRRGGHIGELAPVEVRPRGVAWERQ
jgi:hypothetical protein